MNKERDIITGKYIDSLELLIKAQNARIETLEKLNENSESIILLLQGK